MHPCGHRGGNYDITDGSRDVTDVGTDITDVEAAIRQQFSAQESEN